MLHRAEVDLKSAIQSTSSLDSVDGQREFPATKVMGGGDDRTASYYGPPGPRCGPTSASRPDFHYVGGSSGSDHHFRSGSSSSRQSRNSSSSSNYHSPHVASAGGATASSTSSSRRSGGSGRSSNDYYIEKSSPYHHGGGGGGRSGRGGPPPAPQQDYGMLLRQQDYEHRMAHHSGSRSDLLDHDHTAAIYEHGLAYANSQPYTFVRMCDGKFVRTAIPIHDFEALDSALAAAPAPTTASGYYRSSVNHTLRRPSKRHVVTTAQDSYACCPRDELNGQPTTGGRSTQSYATLRGRKWVDKQRAACSSGVGDNFGRSVYIDDSRSINSFSDDLALALPPERELHGSGVPMNILMTTSITGNGNGRSNMSRSTDRNLDNLGLSDDDLLIGSSNRTSTEEMLTLLTREPPDGKEKPEPSKSSLLKMETLSRKSSKCDLLSSNSSSNSPQVIQSQQPQTQPQGPGAPQAGNAPLDCRSEAGASSLCGDNSSVHSGYSSAILPPTGTSTTSASSKDPLCKRDSLVKETSMYVDASGSAASGPSVVQPPKSVVVDDLDPPTSGKEWKGVPNSPRIITTGPQSGASLSAGVPPGTGTSPKGATTGSAVSSSGLIRQTRPLLQYNGDYALSVHPQPQVSLSQQHVPPSVVAAPSATTVTSTAVVAPANTAVLASNVAVAAPVPAHESLRRYLVNGTTKFFGVNGEESNEKVWIERRRRVAIKLFGGVKDDFHMDGGNGHHGGGGTSSYEDSLFNDGNGVRLRYDPLSSEMVDGKMVLKIHKPPRNKDSLGSLTGQSLSWVFNSLTTRKIPKHQCVVEHEASRSYQPSNTGIAAYYQADGLALRLPRVPSTHHLHGESPAEEVFFTKPSGSGCDDDPVAAHVARMGALGPGGVPRGISAYNQDPYSRSCSWQLPRPEADIPRMGSDVGATRIWNRLLDAAFDNSDRRKHGMGYLGRLITRRRRAKRRAPESTRKRKLGGNSGDHRPFFTYWMTTVQIFIMLISIAIYGIGPIGIDLYKKSGMVLVTNLDVESVTHLEPANFWIGPSAIDLIHLGAKYAPCMRWDSILDREIKDDRLKERDTACCIRKDRSGCVQSPKSECSKINDPNGAEGPPRSKWWRPAEWYSQYPTEHRRSSGPVCGLDPQYCESPASVAPYIWPDDITKWPICRRKMDVETLEQSGHGHAAEHMVCEVIGHPCCIGIRGQCKITTPEYCMFVGGTFHEEAALCSQVSCLDDVCGLLPFRNRDVPDQFYRVWTPLFLHAGLLHLVLTVALQYWLMRDLEKLCGATRISLIYLGSGMIGNLASAIFVPYRAEVGPAGAHFGLLALAMVEVIHQWPTLKYPEMAILKIVGVTAVLFLAGLLPWVDNYAHLFGFISGFLLSYAIQPYVTFGVYERKRKIILVWICFASVLFLFVGLLLLFYVTPIHDCEVCKYFNCIPITKDFCADQNINLDAEV